jgi:rhamnulokinase
MPLSVDMTRTVESRDRNVKKGIESNRKRCHHDAAPRANLQRPTTEPSVRYAAIDLGAESGRVVVGDFDGHRLSLDVVHRFANVPVSVSGTLHWDVLRLFGDISAGLRKAGAAGELASCGVDTWGVDFGLLDGRGRLLANPIHYRDARTAGMTETAFETISREELYAVTGIALMEINTIFQLLAMARADDPLLDQADRLLMTADLFAHFLAGSSVAEYTLASTSQALDARSRDWARPLLERLGIPTSLLPEIVPPGTIVGGLVPDLAASSGLSRTRVVLPASHDTASAVVGTPLVSPSTAFLSSGTWSLVGLETREPAINAVSRAANLTNEGGANDAILLLANVVGLWLVQESRRALWADREPPTYEALAGIAEAAPAFTAFIDPDDERFLRPGDLPSRIREFCAETGQPVPEDPGTLIRVILESLALRYAAALDQLAQASGRTIDSLRIVGGGSSNRLLCRLTANATGLEVRAGPTEATAIGSLALQAIAAGELASVAEARELTARSFPPTTYEPAGDWAEARARFARVCARAAG